jgi:hypothetical protein
MFFLQLLRYFEIYLYKVSSGMTLSLMATIMDMLFLCCVFNDKLDTIGAHIGKHQRNIFAIDNQERGEL